MKTSSREHLVHLENSWGYIPDGLHVWNKMQRMYNPKNVLEIGFHLGHSTTWMLEEFLNAKVTSISPGFEHTLDGAKLLADTREQQSYAMKDVFGDRFTWIPKGTIDSYDELENYGPFDFALIDGQHTYEHTALDLNCCSHFGVKQLLIDNVDQHQVLSAVNHSRWNMIRMFPYISDDNINVLGLLVL